MESSKGWSQLLQENRERGKTSEFCARGSVATLHSLCREFFDQKQRCVDKAFLKSTDGSFGRNTVYREGKSVFNCISASENRLVSNLRACGSHFTQFVMGRQPRLHGNVVAHG